MNCCALLKIRWVVLASLLSGLSGCSVYVPMQGAAPEIRHRGELEVAGSWALTNRFEVGATYSPLNHLLVRAATSTKPDHPTPGDSTSYAQANQYELAVGTYWPLGSHWLVGGLAGFGQAHAEAQYKDDGNTIIHFGSYDPVRHRIDAIYSKYSGEVYATWQPSPVVSTGLSYRLVQLRLTDVTDQGLPVRSGPILRSEPMFFFRVRPSASGASQGGVQLQAALGFSDTLGYDQRSAADASDPARQFKLGRSYMSVGVAVFPHLLWQKR
jgi:hypothetical protein